MYQDARRLNKELKKFSKEKFPQEEQFSLLRQLWRALDSVALNIAEGSNRGSDKDFARFLNNAHTSINEVVTREASVFYEDGISRKSIDCISYKYFTVS